MPSGHRTKLNGMITIAVVTDFGIIISDWMLDTMRIARTSQSLNLKQKSLWGDADTTFFHFYVILGHAIRQTIEYNDRKVIKKINKLSFDSSDQQILLTSLVSLRRTDWNHNIVIHQCQLPNAKPYHVLRAWRSVCNAWFYGFLRATWIECLWHFVHTFNITKTKINFSFTIFLTCCSCTVQHSTVTHTNAQ